jgi:hypothetical protein
MATRYVLLNWRLAFGQGLWVKSKPAKADPGVKEKFRISLLGEREHPQLPEINKIIRAEAQGKFGAKWEATLKAAEAQQKVCLRDGDLKAEYEGFADHWAISANSFTRPTAFKGKEPVTEDSGIIYSGCNVNAIVTFKAYDNVSKGVTCELNGVQWHSANDAFAGGKAADPDEFPDEIAAPAEDDDLLV